MGFPYLLPALAARRCLFSWAALQARSTSQYDAVPPGALTHSVSKKCSGSADCIGILIFLFPLFIFAVSLEFWSNQHRTEENLLS